VDVTRIFQTLFQASYSSSCTGYTPEWWGAMEYPESTGIPCSYRHQTQTTLCGCISFFTLAVTKLKFLQPDKQIDEFNPS